MWSPAGCIREQDLLNSQGIDLFMQYISAQMFVQEMVVLNAARLCKVSRRKPPNCCNDDPVSGGS